MPDEAVPLLVMADDLVVLNNALNEVCHSLDLDDFETRIGFGRNFARELLSKVQALLANIPRTS